MWPDWNCIAQNYLLGCGEQRGSLMHEGPMCDLLGLRYVGMADQMPQSCQFVTCLWLSSGTAPWGMGHCWRSETHLSVRGCSPGRVSGRYASPCPSTHGGVSTAPGDICHCRTQIKLALNFLQKEQIGAKWTPLGLLGVQSLVGLF